mmetsp:Transcript_60427/g.179949  ORF Transcript_60427/g.179949 Transcript_60427/m.179949 type:complete len:245 (-) Transcript_60427:916-1650(-)
MRRRLRMCRSGRSFPNPSRVKAGASMWASAAWPLAKLLWPRYSRQLAQHPSLSSLRAAVVQRHQHMGRRHCRRPKAAFVTSRSSLTSKTLVMTSCPSGGRRPLGESTGASRSRAWRATFTEEVEAIQRKALGRGRTRPRSPSRTSWSGGPTGAGARRTAAAALWVQSWPSTPGRRLSASPGRRIPGRLTTTAAAATGTWPAYRKSPAAILSRAAPCLPKRQGGRRPPSRAPTPRSSSRTPRRRS